MFIHWRRQSPQAGSHEAGEDITFNRGPMTREERGLDADGRQDLRRGDPMGSEAAGRTGEAGGFEGSGRGGERCSLGDIMAPSEAAGEVTCQEVGGASASCRGGQQPPPGARALQRHLAGTSPQARGPQMRSEEAPPSAPGPDARRRGKEAVLSDALWCRRDPGQQALVGTQGVGGRQGASWRNRVCGQRVEDTLLGCPRGAALSWQCPGAGVRACG